VIRTVTTKRAYPDTPVAMHYRPFKEIDWCKLVGADDVVLVITPVFLREVDEHKDHKRGALQRRARRMNSWLGELRKTKSWEIRPGVRVEVNTREPELDVDFAAHGLQPSVNDDKIVGCMVRDAVVHPGVPLVCVTSDNALGYKVDGAGFEVVEPPEDVRLPDEPDQAEREKRELQKQIIELKKRVEPEPDLSLRFDGGGGACHHRPFLWA
jgi:predicted ribonuclease YlaK